MTKTASKSKSGGNTKRRAGDFDTFIGGKIRERRNVFGLTQDKLAELLEVSPQQIQKYECGHTRVPVSRLNDLSQILEVEPSWFFTESGYVGTAEGGATTNGAHKTGANSATNDDFRQGALELLDIYLSLDDAEKRSSLVEIARVLVANK